MRKLIFITPVLVITVFTLLVVNFFHAPVHASNTPIAIVSVENAYGSIASQIGGKYVSVYNILEDPAVDPQKYELSLTDATFLKHAKIVIANGGGYDTFLNRMIDLDNTTDQVTLNVSDILHVSQSDNPYYWYNISDVEFYASTLKTSLKNIDPAHASYYGKNYTHFIASLEHIRAVCIAIKMKYNTAVVISTTPVADDLLTACGLQPMQTSFEKALDEGKAPSSAAMQSFKNSLTKGKVNLFVYHTQSLSTSIEKMNILATEHKVPIVGVSEIMPQASNYQEWITGVLNTIQNALHTTSI